MLTGYFLHEVDVSTQQSWRYQEIVEADILVQDALELGKQQLMQDAKWRGVSNWIARPTGNCQYKIQSTADLPLSPSIQTAYPNGVMIQGTGKTKAGSLRVATIWWIPSTHMTKAFQYD
jgi:hypothetical protein